LNPPSGLTILSAVPTTLGIGVSLVRSCKGNEGLALLLTVVSNLCGVVTIPLWLKALFQDNDTIGISFDTLDLFVRLVITIFTPSLIGKVLRETCKPVKKFTATWKTALSITATTNLAMIVWQTLSGAQSVITNTPFVNTLYVILLAIGQHIVYLILNFATIV
jgi:solute carrier family 10 (sodium/bile acid cotransporter), member 7